MQAVECIRQSLENCTNKMKSVKKFNPMRYFPKNVKK